MGRFKASFFETLGYQRGDWQRLRSDLIALGCTGSVRRGHVNDYGQKYEVHGTLNGPGGRAAHLVSIWILLDGEDRPRLVTAVPGELR